MAPFSAADRAAHMPAAPAPTTTTSNVSVAWISLSAIGFGFGRKLSVAPPSELLAKTSPASVAGLAVAASANPNAPTPTAPAAVPDSKLRRDMPCSSTVLTYGSASSIPPELSSRIVTSAFGNAFAAASNFDPAASGIKRC